MDDHIMPENIEAFFIVLIFQVPVIKELVLMVPTHYTIGDIKEEIVTELRRHGRAFHAHRFCLQQCKGLCVRSNYLVPFVLPVARLIRSTCLQILVALNLSFVQVEAP